MKKYLQLMSIILVIVGAYFLGSYNRGSQISSDRRNALKAGQSFISQTTASSFDSAYNASSPQLQNALTLDEFKAEFASLDGAKFDKNSDSVYIGERNTLYLQSVSGLKNSPSGNETGLLNLILAKEDGKWKVQSAAIQ